MARAIATIEGTALVPGVSKNGRHYSKEAIAKAVARLSERLADGSNPAVMLTSHSADDDSRRIVGRLDSVSLTDDGSARFTAQIADTDEGRKIAALVDTRHGPAFLKGVSIRGAWIGKVRREIGPDGKPYEEAPDLEIDGLDFTRKPGVPGAQIDNFIPASVSSPAETALNGRALIYESVQEALVTAITEDARVPAPDTTEADASAKDKAPYGDDANYADPGYQKDKKKRYPLNTKQRAKSAWSYINQADNARLYTSAQLKRIKQRIVKALKGYGVQVSTQERWLIEPAAQVTEALAECWDMDPAEGNLYLSLTNGPTTVTVSSRILDAHDLDLVGRAAMAGACDALMGLDPDMDADIDVPGAEPEDTDHDMDAEPEDDAPGSACACGCGCAVPHPMAVADGCPCGCGCSVCKATEGDATESVQIAVAGQPLRPEHLAALKETGVLDRLQPGEVLTAAMANEALALHRQATEESAAPETPAPETAADNPTQETEPAMAESTTPAAETPGTTEDNGLDALSAKFDKLTDAITGLVTSLAPKPATAESAPAEPVTEAAPEPVQETQEQRIDRLVAERVAAATTQMVQETVERYGPPSRKGLVHQVTETSTGGAGANGLPEGWPDKPLHTYTREERSQYLEPLVVDAFLGDRANKA
ncbi:DUF6582 domain-containing protein [Streptomyces violascens]|uniref:DUF6582 domain-containing protein n=1 Tax=Streptomyces violascens TaxID=67381 RepID=UPI0036A68D0D